MIIDPGVRNVGILVFDSVTGWIKLWTVKSLLPLGRSYVMWSALPHVVKNFIEANKIWFNCMLYCIENQFVARSLIQRVQTCLECFLDGKGRVYVYPANKVRKGLGLQSFRNWEKNKKESVRAAEEIIGNLIPDCKSAVSSVFASADFKKRHNLADVLLGYAFFRTNLPS